MPVFAFFMGSRVKTELQLISSSYELKDLKHVLSRPLRSRRIDTQVIITRQCVSICNILPGF